MGTGYGDYVIIRNFIAMKANDDDYWRVSRIEYEGVGQIAKLIYIEKFATLPEATEAMTG